MSSRDEEAGHMKRVTSGCACFLIVVCLTALHSSAHASSPVRISNQEPGSASGKEAQKKREDQKAEDAATLLSKKDRERGRRMLEEIKVDLKEFYYDPKFHGLDLDARFKLA